MALTRSVRQSRELPLLVLSVALVLSICLPLKQWLQGNPFKGTDYAGWVERMGSLILGPEQIVCYCAFLWGVLIMLGRYLELRRQQKAFNLGLLPTEEGSRILPEDARPLQRKSEQAISQYGPLVLANLIRLALGKYAISRSSKEVSETVRTQADVDLGRLVSGMATVQYLAWAIPAIGFLGTVRGLGMGMGMAGKTGLDPTAFLNEATTHLNVAFDCTLIALGLSLPLMFLLHSVQRDEENLVIDCQQYCLEHLFNRIYDPEPMSEEMSAPRPRMASIVRAAP